MARYIDADALLDRLPNDLPYKASVKRVLMQAPEVDVVQKIFEELDGITDLFAKGLIEEFEMYDMLSELKKKHTEGKT